MERLATAVSKETTAGFLLIGAAVVALVWANSPVREAYNSLADLKVGTDAVFGLKLDLALSTWAADGLLAIFFFVVGLELKHEIVAGSLRNPREAAVPVLAAIGGMALPAIVYAVVVLSSGVEGAGSGWAIPTATDIAFALAVLAVFGRGLPVALRLFLLTLAVVDDLLAVTIIAVFYTEGLSLGWLGAGLAAIAAFAIVTRQKWSAWWALLPLAVVAWVFVHESGVHATIAGVLLGFVVPARTRIFGENHTRVHQFEEVVRPISSGLALPLFAFFAAGVTVVGGDGLGALVTDPIVLGVAGGLVLGKVVGVLGVTWLVTTVTPFRLPNAIGVRDLLPVSFLTGIGFTVSLLIAELSFSNGDQVEIAKAAVLGASVIAAVLAASTLRWDAHRARSSDMNRDGVPDGQVALIGESD
ncbi:Na+/H+ antiporter NhaA [Nocardioidaceae bacterium]|nr:Na+/H+ antiporter NhaA [Nocardioidaceae bacterium]